MFSRVRLKRVPIEFFVRLNFGSNSLTLGYLLSRSSSSYLTLDERRPLLIKSLKDFAGNG
jgi:hypothetical protein